MDKMNKMIDMSKAFGAVCKYFHLGNAMECNRLYKALEEAYELTEQSEPRWVSVEERLPEDGRYLCTYENDGRICVDIGIVADGEWNDWYVMPTAWMPLPKPYERSEDV